MSPSPETITAGQAHAITAAAQPPVSRVRLVTTMAKAPSKQGALSAIMHGHYHLSMGASHTAVDVVGAIVGVIVLIALIYGVATFSNN